MQVSTPSIALVFLLAAALHGAHAQDAAPAIEAPLAPINETRELEAADIIPSIVPRLATDAMVDIDLLYNGISVNMALLEPPQAAELPEIVISGASPDTLYTLIVTDPDAPTPSNPIRGQILHGVITNIANGAVSEGDVVTPYRGPGPPAGVHRYIFLLYEQPGEVQLPDYSAGENGRTGFNVTAYAQENGLGDPVAGAYFLSRPLL